MWAGEKSCFDDSYHDGSGRRASGKNRLQPRSCRTRITWRRGALSGGSLYGFFKWYGPRSCCKSCEVGEDLQKASEEVFN